MTAEKPFAQAINSLPKLLIIQKGSFLRNAKPEIILTGTFYFNGIQFLKGKKQKLVRAEGTGKQWG